MTDATFTHTATRCSSCGAEVVWGVTGFGLPIALDFPAETRLLLELDPRLRPGDRRAVPHPTFVAHSATCRNAHAAQMADS